MMKVGTACDSAAQKTQRAARNELLGCEKSRVKLRLAPLSSAVQHDDAIANVSYKPFVDQLDLMTMVAAVMALQETRMIWVSDVSASPAGGVTTVGFEAEGFRYLGLRASGKEP